MVVGTDQQEEGKERGIIKKKRGGAEEGGKERPGRRSTLKKKSYGYTGTPQASNSCEYMNSHSFSASSLHPSFPPSVRRSGSAAHSQCGPGVIRADPALSRSAFIRSPSFIPSFLFAAEREGGKQNSHTSPKLIFY